jgi:xanthine dehydrogenase iron-sulfur cluster and FAD-binding subunit A
MSDSKTAYEASVEAYREALTGLSDADLRSEFRNRDIQETILRSLVEAEMERRKAQRRSNAAKG